MDNKLISFVLSFGFSDHLGGDVAYTGAVDQIGGERVIHQDGDHSRKLHCCIPAINVPTGVSLGDSDLLGMPDRLIKAVTRLHAEED